MQADNTAAMHKTQFHRCNKHVSIKHFFIIREKVSEKIIQQIPTQDEIADLMTTPLFKPRLLTLCNKMES